MTVRRICLLCLMMLVVQPVLAATSAVREMAGILVNLEHYPSAAEKSRLKELAANKDNTEQEKVVANAIANLSHTASDADKSKLKKLMDDATAPAEVRDLAVIILRLNHKPSATDKDKLQQMMK